MDLNKDLTLSELTKEITEVFFPNGVSEAQNIRIAEVDFYIAAFSGEKLVHVDDDENFFSLGTYFQQIKTNPVRMYLHTVLVSNVTNFYFVQL